MVGGHETGNETYIKGLVEGFAKLHDGLDLLVYNIGSPWAAPEGRVRFQRLLSAHPYVRLGMELPLRTLSQRLDVLHTTYVAPLWSAAPLVLTVHDISYVTNSEWFSARDLQVLNNNVPRSIRKASHVITVSNDARARIMETYHVPEASISAIYNGPGPAAQPITIDEAKGELSHLGFESSRPYVLAVGNLQPRKNLVRLIEAFKAVVGRGRDVYLVIAGPRHHRAQDALDAAAAVSNRIHFTGYVTDRQLAACYRCATAFVFPSLYEGFGLPAIEAMSHGIPSACAGAGALPEICGNAALLFNPRSVEAIADAVSRLLDDADLRQKLSAAGLARAKEFSWARSAQQTLKVYEQARS
jgi:glycosyltransferase involved in cell wall biosynthesis